MNTQKTQFTSLDEVLTIDGFKVTAYTEHDDTFHETPWERDDSHGPVSEWTTREKEEGERVLSNDRYHFRYYNFDAAVKQAMKELWDAAPYGQGTPEERAIKAVEADFKRLQDWCDDVWHYVGVIVRVEKAGIELGYASVWGIESDDLEYQVDVTNELLKEALDAAKRKLQELAE